MEIINAIDYETCLFENELTITILLQSAFVLTFYISLLHYVIVLQWSVTVQSSNTVQRSTTVYYSICSVYKQETTSTYSIRPLLRFLFSQHSEP